ncbi:TrmH family RNA methyltransferase [Mycoplasma testudineum]|uniref:TrmH family RNA methyltransferase n=1 Tax=Mycoplasma testudineum TaxID=244584 RepID=A0A4R6IH08_9MOLU|nr:RNA methyltransferase [Mycoplasma testudineum]OYD27070.1 23S rRNA methyltransferase [Mycoplasma testudineum]TDO21176.1 TrmH family RNA methyltransferase [Mycoplasma testudineum]
MITSKDNPTYKYLKSLQTKKGRKQHSKFIIEGYKMIAEIKKKGINITTYGKNADIEMAIDLLANISQLETNPEIIGVVNFLENTDILNSKKILYLDNVQDPGNVGTLLRSAVAFNFDTVVFRNIDIYNWKTIQASRNAHFDLKLIKENDNLDVLKQLHKQKFLILATNLHQNSKTIEEIKILDKLVLILGNEGHGISQEILAIDHQNILIKISSKIESLNVAIAGSILMEKVGK